MNPRTYQSKGYTIFSIINYIIMTVLLLVCLLPMLHVLAVSFSDAASAGANAVTFIPKGFNLAAYEVVFRNAVIGNSFFVSVVRTIANAIKARRGVYHHSLKVRPPFVVVNPIKGTESVSSTKLAQFIRENLQYIFVQDHAMNAARCYVYQDGVYRLMSRIMMQGVIKQFITDYNEHLVKTRQLNEVYDLLLTDNSFISENLLNDDEGIINFQNGLLRLSDMTLQPHSPDVLSTIQLPCDWPCEPKESRYTTAISTC